MSGNRTHREKIRTRPLCAYRIVPVEEIPVFINNRDRVTTLRTLIEWLLSAGTKRIVILDNDSTYAPLLEYYKVLPKEVEVQYLQENCGPWAFWNKDMHKEQTTPYVVTDSDLVPEENCPKDLIQRLNILLNKRPESGKVGPGLCYDDVPQFEGSTFMNGCGMPEQTDYWNHRYNEQAFFANIDTTFALYAAGSNGKISEDSNFDHPDNLRMDKPYLFRHIPWYFTSPITDEEELYYRMHCKKGWSHSYGL